MLKPLNDTVTIKAVLAPPKAGSVSPQQVTQFLRKNKTSRSFIGHISHALSNVPADRWDRVSSYLRSNWSEMSSDHIRTLTSMSMERLDSVLSFVKKNNITNVHTLRALSVISIADLDDFKSFFLNNGFMQRNLYPFIFAHIPKDRWPAFTEFILQKEFDENIMHLGMVYAKHPPENWERLFHFIPGDVTRYISAFVINQLAEMAPNDSMAYLLFLKTHQVTAWNAKSTLVKVPANKRECLYAFATEHKLMEKIGDLAKISDAQWDIVTSFILKHPDTSIDSLAKLPVEQWNEFQCFVDQHQLTDGKWLSVFAQVPAQMRENILSYKQEYNPELYQTYNINSISIDNWPRFMAIIKRLGFTQPDMINKFAQTNPNRWEELASFIAQKNIKDKYVVSALAQAPEARYHALLAFVEKFNIQDQYIIEGLACIPYAQQWESLIRLSKPLLQPPLPPENSSTILRALDEITQCEHRIDRAMPAYDEIEQQGRVAYALAEIADGRMPKNPDQYRERLLEILNTPLNQPVNINQANYLVLPDLPEESTGFEKNESLQTIADDAENIQGDVTTALEQPELKSNTRNWCNYFTEATVEAITVTVATAVFGMHN